MRAVPTSYLIALESPVAQLETIAKHGIVAEWVPAVNARLHTREELVGNQNVSTFLPKVALAIAMSHLKVWKQFLSTNSECALVMEEDVVLAENFRPQLMEALANTPDDMDVLYVGCTGAHATANPFCYFLAQCLFGCHPNAGPVNTHVFVPKCVFSLHAYVVSRRGATRLVDELSKGIFKHVDIQLNQLASQCRIRSYVLNNRLADQTSGSDISTSANQSSHHPCILQPFLQNILLDQNLTLDYALNITLAEYDPVVLTVTSCLFLMLGVVVALFRVPITYVIFGFVLLSWKDISVILSTKRYQSIWQIFFHFLLLILPCIIVLAVRDRTSSSG